MRKVFFDLLEVAIEENPNIVLLTGDLGFNLMDGIREKYPDNFYNMQAAEFCMTGAAIGMHYEGKIPIIYSITPFVLLRNFELLRTYVSYDKIPIKIVGAGRNNDYNSEGISHDASDAYKITNTLSMLSYFPKTPSQLKQRFDYFLKLPLPVFINLKK